MEHMLLNLSPPDTGDFPLHLVPGTGLLPLFQTSIYSGWLSMFPQFLVGMLCVPTEIVSTRRPQWAHTTSIFEYRNEAYCAFRLGYFISSSLRCAQGSLVRLHKRFCKVSHGRSAFINNKSEYQAQTDLVFMLS